MPITQNRMRQILSEYEVVLAQLQDLRTTITEGRASPLSLPAILDTWITLHPLPNTLYFNLERMHLQRTEKSNRMKKEKAAARRRVQGKLPKSTAPETLVEPLSQAPSAGDEYLKWIMSGADNEDLPEPD